MDSISQKFAEYLKKSNELNEDLNVSNTLIQCVRKLSNDLYKESTIDEILQIICEFYQAERCYVLDLDMDNKKGKWYL